MGQRQAAAAPSRDWDHGGVPAAGGGRGPSPLERGLHALVATFYQYARAAGPGGEPGLDPPALQRLLSRELGQQLTATGQPQAVAALFSLLDADGDGRVTFGEYWQLVAWLCHVLRHRHYGAAPPPPTPAGDPDAAPDAVPPTVATGDGHRRL